MSEENKATKKEKPFKERTPKKSYNGTVMMDFKIEEESYKRGENYTTTDENLFNKLIRLFKINKKQ